jgi:hypothetical protein
LNDPLSQFRRKETLPPITNTTIPGKRLYEAYDKSGRPCAYTEIRCVMQPSQSPQSRFFMALIFSSDFEDAFTLIYSFMAVEVKGKNLREVRRAIQNGRCEFIQEFHEEEFQAPGKNEPVIDSIKFVAGEKLEDILTAYKKG